MDNLVKLIEANLSKKILTDAELAALLEGSPNRRYGLVKRSLAKENLIAIRRGLYALHRKKTDPSFNLYEVSHYVFSPSYVSFESALSHHGLIPEAVYTTTCATPLRSVEFKTPLGVFSYSRIPTFNFYEGVVRVESENGVYSMASPWKALAHYVGYHMKDWMGLSPVVESLRVDVDALRNFDIRGLDVVAAAYKNQRVQGFLDGVRKELAA